ncbi:hypothetical protein GCK32_010852 [Trichostrongylus colubriformis]|uniref:Uncharacterized protein n=1 Tax=Trichostrongylus colubriformis TaxID=6319 RepID=A0AAN8FGK1_TRICO
MNVSVIAAIGSLFIYYALFNATTFLFNYAEERAASLSATTARSVAKSPPKVAKEPTPATVRSSDSRVEWIPVDQVKRQLFNIPPGVDFMPILVSSEQEKSIKEGEKLASLRTRVLPLQRAVWVPSGGSFTQVDFHTVSYMHMLYICTM